MLEVIRRYYNGSSVLLRTDTIWMQKKGNVIVRPATEITYQRVLRVRGNYTGGSRVVVSITVEGNFDTIESSSGNYLSAEWTSPPALLNMTDLPVVGETV